MPDDHIPDLSFSHIGIFVFDLEPMSRFYTEVLGFHVTDRGTVLDQQRIVFLSRDPREHHQIVLVEGRTAARSEVLLNQISLRVPSLADLRAVRERVLNVGGIPEIHPINHVISFSVYFRDPEGNRIEIFCDSPFYVAQPHIEPLDLALDDAAILEQTRDRYQDDPSFCTAEAWRARFPGRAGDS